MKKLSNSAGTHPEYCGMGTTLTAVRIEKAKAEIWSCGDSRAYLIDCDGRIFLLTRDHSEALARYFVDHTELRFPLVNPEDYYEYARNLQAENLIWSCLGIGDPEIFHLEIPLQKKDRILLCTDGVHNYLPYDAFRQIVTNADSPESIVGNLFWRTDMLMLDKIIMGWLGDNITILLHEHDD